MQSEWSWNFEKRMFDLHIQMNILAWKNISILHHISFECKMSEVEILKKRMLDLQRHMHI